MADSYNDGTKNLNNVQGWWTTFTPPATFGGSHAFPGTSDFGIIPATYTASNSSTYTIPYTLYVSTSAAFTNTGTIVMNPLNGITMQNNSTVTNNGTISGDVFRLGYIVNNNGNFITDSTMQLYASSIFNNKNGATLNVKGSLIYDNSTAAINNESGGAFIFGSHTTTNIGTILPTVSSSSSNVTSFGGAIIGSIF